MHFCRRGITLTVASLFLLLVISAYAQVQKPTTKTPAAILNENEAAVALLLSDGDSSTSLGSGFFIEDGSALVTNYHVIEGAKQVYVKIGDKQIVMTSEVYAFDQTHDLAILKVAPPVPKTVRLGNSTQVAIGSPIVVISNPEGLEKSVTNGLVSGLRHLKDETLFQISAPISHGSSGGPVFDEGGQVIGVVVAMLSEGQNLNFAIPVNLVNDLWKGRKETSLASLPKSDAFSDAPSVNANLDGTWSATFADSVSSGQLSFTLMQDGASVRGTYSASLGGGGSVVGRVAENRFSFQLSQSIKDCPGTFTGSADLRANTMVGSYTGADCQGQHLNGTFSMARGASMAQASPARPTPTAATQPEIQYGTAGELKGVNKVFIYGVEPDIRNNMLKQFSKASKLHVVGDIREADIVLVFGANTFSMGAYTNVWTDSNGNGWANTTPRYGITGEGSAVKFVPPNALRIVWQFSATRVSVLQRRPSTNFVRDFIKAWEEANK